MHRAALKLSAYVLLAGYTTTTHIGNDARTEMTGVYVKNVAHISWLQLLSLLLLVYQIYRLELWEWSGPVLPIFKSRL